MSFFNWFANRFQSLSNASASNQAADTSAIEGADTSAMEASARTSAIEGAIPYAETGISGPFCSGNLAVYLIHGPNSIDNGDVITLEEALSRKKVLVEETGIVSQLKIKNLGKEVVFVQSGDIVRGGKQDRTIQHDVILPAQSHFVTINSFCVESGRWSKRGKEDWQHFHSSSHYLSSKSLRLAAKHGVQYEVWNEVANVQQKSAMNAKVPLHQAQGESATSLELTLDTEVVKNATEKYVEDLTPVAVDKNDVVGYAFSINGKMNTIDLYASNSLFQKMWPKLLHAAAVEAFTELKEGEEFAPPPCAEVKECMEDVGKDKAHELGVSGRARVVKQESSKNVLYETRDTKYGDKWMHRNYATK